jgi:putative addiction module killer protein
VYEIFKTDEFDRWLRKLKDRRAVAMILIRIQRVEELGNFGDCVSVGGEIRELRIHYAKGYRIYFASYVSKIVILLNGGNKSTQLTDIKKAKNLWEIYKSEIRNDEN